MVEVNNSGRERIVISPPPITMQISSRPGSKARRKTTLPGSRYKVNMSQSRAHQQLESATSGSREFNTIDSNYVSNLRKMSHLPDAFIHHYNVAKSTARTSEAIYIPRTTTNADSSSKKGYINVSLDNKQLAQNLMNSGRDTGVSLRSGEHGAKLPNFELLNL